MDICGFSAFMVNFFSLNRNVSENEMSFVCPLVYDEGKVKAQCHRQGSALLLNPIMA